jgi:hypothetical protein
MLYMPYLFFVPKDMKYWLAAKMITTWQEPRCPLLYFNRWINIDNALFLACRYNYLPMRVINIFDILPDAGFSGFFIMTEDWYPNTSIVWLLLTKETNFFPSFSLHPPNLFQIYIHHTIIHCNVYCVCIILHVLCIHTVSSKLLLLLFTLPLCHYCFMPVDTIPFQCMS